MRNKANRKTLKPITMGAKNFKKLFQKLSTFLISVQKKQLEA